VDGATEARAVYAALLPLQTAGRIAELVPAARTVLVEASPLPDLATLLAGLPPAPAAVGPLVELPVDYDGADLAEVAALSGLDAGEVARRHAAADYTVAFCGFAPGFAYLTGLPPELHVARRDTPRTAVPAGSVAVAGEFTGVYPRRSPGGWRLLGRTDAALWDAGREPPALLAPGTRVRFVP
jgi:KipI family sensor histidine kinase inhibitor